MRIALITSRFPDISQTFVLNQLTGLLDRGHDVTVFARAPKHGAPQHADVADYDLVGRTRYWPVRLHELLPTLSDASLEAWLAGLRAARNLSRIDETVGRLMRPMCAVAAAQEAPFDAILCHFGNSGLLAQWLRDVGSLHGPLAVVFHGSDITSYVRRSGQDVYSRLFERAELLLPISENWRRRLIELGAPKEKIRILRMGIDGSRFEFQPRRLEPDTAVRAVTVAHLVEKKGIEVALQAVAKAAAKGLEIEYRVVGDGPQRGPLEKLTDELGIRQRVVFEGWREQDEVADQLRRAHVLLAPSVTSKDGDQEGIPVVLMEAMATGLLVLSTLHSGIPELVPHPYLVVERDVDALVTRLEWLVRERERWPVIGEQLRAKVLADFNLDRLNDQLVELLASLPAGRDRSTLGRATS